MQTPTNRSLRSLSLKLLSSILLAGFGRTSLAVALLSVGGLSSVATAHAAPVAFDIPASKAPAAIDLFIKQSSTRVVYRHDDLKDIQTNAVTGSHEPNAALAILVSGTKLTISERAKDEFAIGLPKPGSIEGSVRDESGRPVTGARVSLADSDQSVLTDKRGRFIFSEVNPGAHSLQIAAEGLQNTRVTDVTVNPGRELSLSPITVPLRKQGTIELEPYTVSAKKNDGVVELDPYSVSGQKARPFTASMDIPRTINDVQPYYVFDAKTIDQSGVQNVADFLKQRLTMNAVAFTSSQQQNAPAGNLSSINLRGLGTANTLILVDGRRVTGVNIGNGAASFISAQPDVNGIPLVSIDHIEVLPSSASGIYGGSAVGGVVNIILKKNYTGGELRATYANTFESDASIRTVSGSFGAALEDGKVGSSRVDLQACKLEYSIVSPK